jgi:hypothetical protein
LGLKADVRIEASTVQNAKVLAATPGRGISARLAPHRRL